MWAWLRGQPLLCRPERRPPAGNQMWGDATVTENRVDPEDPTIERPPQGPRAGMAELAMGSCAGFR